MIERIVKMEFQPNKIEDFFTIFHESKSKIETCEGCIRVRLLQCTKDKKILFTHSLWESEKHLEAYRKSDLFKETWAKTKVLFESKAVAWSLTENIQLEK